MSPQTVLGQPSWRIATPDVEAFVTVAGGHLGPVRFRLGDRTVEPFSVAPWAEEPLGQPDVQMLRSLRGDFFCMPFGGNENLYQGEQHPQHGDTANLDWTLEAASEGEITLSLQTETRPGRIEKRIRIEGTTIYQTHTISQMSGPMCYGHHAMLRFPSEGRLSTSEIFSGRVFPGAFERPKTGGYTSLLPRATFDTLDQVPLADGGQADLTRYPAREGFEDLVQIYHQPESPFAWNAVVVDGYLWLALKDPNTLPSTVLWHSNGGRHYRPWNGRHRRVLGVEDVCAYFHYGLAESAAPNDAPVRTFMQLSPDKPTEIRYTMAVAAVPDDFGVVASVEPTRQGVEVRDAMGTVVSIAVDMEFVL
ncbi:hypothetical protein EON82_03435 [bacterium]|nr:MAG: hypothetical protein EON82_03435 [bacterium]